VGGVPLDVAAARVTTDALCSLPSVFTGIVREVGVTAAIAGSSDGIRLEIEAPVTASATSVGDSVAIDGCCLSAVAVGGGRIAFDAVPETLSRTSLGNLSAGARVNIEPALRAGEPLGGHYVQGHVDGIGAVRSVEADGTGRRIWIDADPQILRYAVEKGSITVQGVSLTVAELDDAGFAVALVPHTLEATTLGELEPGHAVNLEVDVLAKYVERLLIGG
jgi:riboflavin synthase